MPYDNMPKSMWPIMEKCVAKVKKQNKGMNAYAVCYNSVMGKRKKKKKMMMEMGG